MHRKNNICSKLFLWIESTNNKDCNISILKKKTRKKVLDLLNIQGMKYKRMYKKGYSAIKCGNTNIIREQLDT